MMKCCHDHYESAEQEAENIVDDMTDSEVLARANELITKAYETLIENLRDQLKQAIYERIKYGQ